MSTSADIGSGSSAASAPGEQIARVSIKIPPLWRRNVKVWRLQVDAHFANSPVTQELTKYNYLLASLDGDVAELISDLLLKPLSVTPYSDLMDRLQAEFEISEGRKVNRLLTELDLGDRKPSQLFREMRSLAGSQVQDDFLKTMFLQRLPVHIRAILASSSDPLDNLAVMADKVFELSPNQYPSLAVHAAEASSATAQRQVPLDRVDRLEAQIAQLTGSVAALHNHSHRSWTVGVTQPRSRSATPKSNPNDRSICHFHARYGTKAHRCLLPCSFQPPLVPGARPAEN
ncbi:hypothetical protein GE061_001666 [Apolygus lucorum]|uniref:DUF7041 domain-containing protein n=1 Tax=Apolygus lucorum TaxID=248454 RepID=A0A8S9Y7Q3_APOLU|nr:hypothetical protein GE061_001666 [Apolygus lucorum]